MNTRHGIIHGMTNHDYHLGGQEISNSGLSAANRSMAHYQHYLMHGSGIGAKAALEGSLVHCAILEPEELANRYLIAPAFDKRTKEGKAAAAAFAEEAGDRELITIGQADLAAGARAGVLADQTLIDLMAGGRPEVSVFWKDTETGLRCRCRPDWLNGDTIIDVKTTDDARYFYASVSKYGYHRQAAFYWRGCREAGLNIRRFLFMAVEKSAPFAHQLYELDLDYLTAGQAACRVALENIATAEFAEDWPGYPEGVRVITKPAWLEVPQC